VARGNIYHSALLIYPFYSLLRLGDRSTAAGRPGMISKLEFGVSPAVAGLKARRGTVGQKENERRRGGEKE